MEKKKYLFIVPSLSKGGAERVVSVLASELIPKGRDAVVVTHFQAEKEYPVNSAVKIICLSELDEESYRKKMSGTYLIKLAGMLRNVIVQQKPDYMTYHEDVAAVKDSFKKMLENGVYKDDLFSDL